MGCLYGFPREKQSDAMAKPLIPLYNTVRDLAWRFRLVTQELLEDHDGNDVGHILDRWVVSDRLRCQLSKNAVDLIQAKVVMVLLGVSALITE